MHDKLRLPEIVYEMDEERLTERIWTRVYCYGRWDRNFGAVCKDEFGDYDFLPRWELVVPSSQTVQLFASSDHDELSLFGPLNVVDAASADSNNFGVRERWKQHRRRYLKNRSVRQYVNLIPENLRQTVADLGQYQWAALEGVHHIERFGDHLTNTISQFGPNVIKFCFELVQLHDCSKSQRLAFYRRLIGRTTRDVIEYALDCSLAVDALKVVGRLDTLPTERDNLRALASVLLDETKVRVLKGEPKIVGDAVPCFAKLPRWMVTSKVVQLLNSSHPSILCLEDQLDDAEQTVIEPSDRQKFTAYLSQSSTSKAFARRLRNELMESCWNRGTPYLTPNERRRQLYPEPPAPGNAKLIPLRSYREVKEESAAMSNCLAGYDALIRSGDAYAYKWVGNERATAVISAPHPDMEWFLSDCAQANNGDVSRQTRRAIEAIFAQQLGTRFQKLEQD